jgi:hypothetical protein
MKLATKTLTPTLDIFSEPFEKLRTEYPDEYEQHGLDAVVVAILAPLVNIHLS